ncbi:Calmodulin-like protein 3 [Tetrabaena socialis]|uniref:Calmodulin-like protein 3 n=1 Tax=Tetrabaena socialis TaxID=47790 RepID=A0A2J8A5X6_9CHLO|nr:Calmodulin-like protein 3 [Tetrabaena socialis]|eukprot:PNH07905.1 Calmodulin-like protein 3 [Tetrabaena socialis]
MFQTIDLGTHILDSSGTVPWPRAMARRAPGVREDPRLPRESVDSTRASMVMGVGGAAGRASGYAPAPSFRPASPAGGGGSAWALEPITFDRRPYLLDRSTNAVYADGGADQYPELVGRWQDGRVVLRDRNVVLDLFTNLDRHLRENKVKFSDLFSTFDADGSGTLEIRELAQLVRQLVPGTTAAEVKYIMALLDTSGDGSVTQQEFLAAAKSSLNAAKQLQADRASGATAANSDVQAVLRRVTDYLRANRVDAYAVFKQFDTDRNERLEPSELARFFAAAVPGLRDEQLRYLMAHMVEHGSVFAARVRLLLLRPRVRPCRASGYAPAPSFRPASPAGGGGSAWALEPITFDRRPYLLDRSTNAVYADGGADQYPELVGRWQDGRVVLRDRNVVLDLFTNLDRHLRENKVKFSDLFSTFDADGSGTLEIRELAQLVRQLVPGTTAAEVKYIMALLDTSGDGSVTQQEFLAAAKSSLNAAKQLQADRASGATAANSDVQAVLRRVTDYLRANRVDAYAVFKQFDTDRNERLEPSELARFFAAAVPGLRDEQLRYLMAHMVE